MANKKSTAHQKSRPNSKWVKTKDGRKVLNTAYKGVNTSGNKSTPIQILENNTEGRHSASVSTIYGHASVEADHLHNSFISEIPAIEEFYYSSPQGRAELRRRAEQSHNDEYVKLNLKLDNGYTPKTPDLPENLDSKINLGKNLLQELSRKDRTRDMRHDRSIKAHPDDNSKKAVRHYLTSKSGEWMESLTVSEQEAISRLTSNGTMVMRAELGEKFEDDIEWDNEAPILQDVMSAMKKAPKFETPVKIYRGTSSEDIDNGIRSKVPQSASANLKQAMSFEKGVLLEIEQVTAAVPGNVGAWGIKEEEVFTNPYSNYEETGRRQVDPHEGHESLAGEFTITVISMREVPNKG